MKKQRSTTGFTLIELMIVIVVIAILATITIVSYNGVQQNTRNLSRIETVTKIVDNLHIYQATYGKSALIGLLLNNDQCIGTVYPDVDPGAGYSCRYVEYNTSPVTTSSTPVNNTLYSELGKIGNYNANYLPVTQTNFANVNKVVSSAPFLMNYSTAMSGYTYTMNGGAAMNSFIALSYRLEGNDQDCKLRPIYRQDAVSGTQIQYSSTYRNSAVNGGATECWLWLDFLK
jgi:prepilin-type N-terminal cleavage/methylation domain-containing protein